MCLGVDVRRRVQTECPTRRLRQGRPRVRPRVGRTIGQLDESSLEAKRGYERCEDTPHPTSAASSAARTSLSNRQHSDEKPADQAGAVTSAFEAHRLAGGRASGLDSDGCYKCALSRLEKPCSQPLCDAARVAERVVGRVERRWVESAGRICTATRRRVAARGDEAEHCTMVYTHEQAAEAVDSLKRV
eukprot:scaffold100396_cov33-Tisochrysis_lutea.AAC.2